MANARDSKTIKLRSAEPVANEQTGLLELLIKVNAYLENIANFGGYLLKFGTCLLVFLIAGVIVNNILADRKQRIVIDPVTVPKIMEDQGYTGLVAANVVAAKISQIQQRTKTIAGKERFELSEQPIPDIALPESGISLASAVAFLEQSLGFSQPHVHAELMAASGTSWDDNTTVPVVISVQLAGTKNDSSQTLVDVHTPDDAFGSTSTEVLKIAEPYVLGIYENDHEHDIDAALELMRRARDQEPRNPEVYVGWGWILVSKGNFAEAIEKYKLALSFKPKYVYAHGYWANTLQRMGDYEGAINKCKRALKDDGNYADAYGYWGNALRGKRNYEGAIAEYQEELRHHPKNAIAYGNWGYTLLRKRDYDGAIAEYEQAIKSDPHYADAYSNWGNALQKKHDYDGAIAKYKEEFRYPPKKAEAYSNWGNALQDKHDYDGAIAEYQQAIKYDSQCADAYRNWGNALQGKRDYDGAITKYKQALALNPYYVDAYGDWGNALQGKGDYGGAIAKYTQALALDSYYVDAYGDWGNALRAQQDYDGAIAKYKEALALDPGNEEVGQQLNLALLAKQSPARSSAGESPNASATR